jgi:hypothetical protein
LLRAWQARRIGTYQALEGCFEKEQVGCFLVAADLAQRDGAWLVARLLAFGRGACLSNCVAGQFTSAMHCLAASRDLRLLPESLRAPALAPPPRDPVLARPPREGRALLSLVGVLGAIMGVVLGSVKGRETRSAATARPGHENSP